MAKPFGKVLWEEKDEEGNWYGVWEHKRKLYLLAAGGMQWSLYLQYLSALGQKELLRGLSWEWQEQDRLSTLRSGVRVPEQYLSRIEERIALERL